MHLREDELELYATGRLPSTDADTVTHHLAECPNCAERLAVTENFLRAVDDLAKRQLSYSRSMDRRQHPRKPTDDDAVLRVVNPLLPDQWNVRVLDVSKNGLKLVTPVCLQPNMTVQVRWEKTIAVATVRYCTKSGPDFHVGVHIQDVIQTPSATPVS